MEQDGEQDQEERPRRYVLEEYRQRNIPKFGVQGQEYRLSVDLQDRHHGYERPQTYTQMLVVLHSVLQGNGTYVICTRYFPKLNFKADEWCSRRKS